MHAKDKQPRNEQRQRHGLWEEYYFNGQLGYKVNYIKGVIHGCLQSYGYDGKLYNKGFYAR